ncbi:GNAT family N-acetyltransferase [Levilactobacillus acidifarinae]|uniref:N-acetyltransferase domain-containing protein n=1 Tax=Levilactobacillus acidifarinae DSM 19394 = JCM 15949 TaxID=1423715 RepID=A0A0R1LU25_9LACO|nr:GNAT family N-acetyltransferase [Levilactobacillus acidifarinae]KRK95882.1 hypothetical protein FD25_GL002342 [Levilactobacillus acidifarinae DSM 19394]GEO69182.1 hypothetical protein LAC03_10920 [Levilactobacillus acidifarinae]
MQINVAPVLTAAELETVTAIWLAGNLEAHPFVDPAYWRAHQAEVRIQLGETPLITASEAGKVIGFLGLQNDYIAGLFVTAAWQHRGVGRQLVATAQAQHQRLTLAVYQKNTRAVSFYCNLGFTESQRTIEPETGLVDLTMQWSHETRPSVQI